MIYSMTGFGKSSLYLKDTQYIIELKSLNSKQADVFMRLPAPMKELEVSLRKVVIDQLSRGKIELLIHSSSSDDNGGFSINVEAVEKYKNELAKIDIPGGDMLGALLRLPNVVVQEESTLTEGEVALLHQALIAACDDLSTFRRKEGESLEVDLSQRIKSILSHKEAVMRLAPKRIDRLRARMVDNLNAIKGELEINAERLEQELIFYIEKLDVSEEFVRLQAHCEYFEQLMQEESPMKGKKLNFISQEMGREINTLGSKANDAEIQKHVVQMKDELEKIKEQVLNIL
ncbi:YicC family protein [Chitinophagales bacterium]|nr:YicC family protein [Chitinophagales bacterium]